MTTMLFSYFRYYYNNTCLNLDLLLLATSLYNQ